MIFMQFKYSNENKIWIQLDHIVSVKECPDQADRTLIEMDSGTRHEVLGCAEDILKGIIGEYRER